MINKMYERPEVIDSLRKVWQEQESIQMKVFLEPEVYEKLAKEIKAIYLKKINIPLEGSYSCASFQKKEIVKSIDRWVSKVIGRQGASEQRIFSFKHRDYIICSDKRDEKGGIMAILEMTKMWGEDWGGYTSLIKDNEEIIRIIPSPNTFTMINMKGKVKKFVKYVNRNTGKNKREFIEFFYER